jgi:carnitine O-acetyltransferase
MSLARAARRGVLPAAARAAAVSRIAAQQRVLLPTAAARALRFSSSPDDDVAGGTGRAYEPGFVRSESDLADPGQWGHGGNNKHTGVAGRRSLFESSRIDYAAEWRHLPGTKEEWDSSKPLWSRQSEVPHLPLPLVEDTMRRFERYVKPLLSIAELDRARSHIRSFLESGDADTLQAELERIQQESETGSYIEGFWNSMYLELRDSQMINTTPFLLLGLDFPEDTPSRGAHNQLERAAAVAYKVADFEARIRTGQLEPDADKSGPMDSTQYSRLFSSARVPQPGRDFMRYARHHRSRHIVVIRNNHIFAVDVLDQSPGRPDETRAHSENRIFASLQAVVRNSSYTARKHDSGSGSPKKFERRSRHKRFDPETGERNPHPNVGALTAMNRDDWARVRSHLVDDRNRQGGFSANRRSLSIIESALCVLCLDSHNPKGLQETSQHLLAAAKNRWWDKTQFVVLPDARVGLLLEHTAVDGHTAIRVCDEIKQHLQETPTPALAQRVAEYLEAKKAGTELPQSSLDTAESRPEYFKRTFLRELDFVIDDVAAKEINRALSGIEEAAVGLDTSVLKFSKFGAAGIKQAGFSPDAFVQMAYQLAYFRMCGQLDSTYESANTKGFLAGRTETLRVVTEESEKFAKTWAQPGDMGEDVLLDTLVSACEAHVARMKEAKSGLGVDRHLYAMNRAANQLRDRKIDFSVPQLFRDGSYSKLATSVLSTSNVSHPCFHLFGFGPVCPQGLGIAYNVHPSDMYFNVTSFRDKARSFTDQLTQALTDMMELAQRAKATP